MNRNPAALAWDMLFRALTGAMGLTAGLWAVHIPFAVYWNESLELSATRNDGLQPSFTAIAGHWLANLIFAGFLALISYVLLRFCLRPRKQSERRANAASV
jgi:hypothetical protein